MTFAAVRSKAVVLLLLLLSHCLLLIPLFVGVFGPCFLMQYLDVVCLLFWQSSILAKEERAGCFSSLPAVL